MTQFEFDAKAGNRALRKLGATLGGMTERFDPDAEDGDGDGLVQDSTPFERPATPSAPRLPTTTPTPTDDAGDTGSPSKPKRRSLFSKPKPVRKRKGDRPIGHPKWLHGRTPEEIARLVVPSNMDEAREAYILFAAGQRSAYSSDEAYEAAKEQALFQFLDAEMMDTLNKGKLERGEITEAMYIEPDFEPETVARARELVQKSLETSPLHYWVVQNFGHPQVVINKYGHNHTENWMFYSTHQNIITMTPESLDKAGDKGFAEFYTIEGIYGRSHADPTNEGSLRHEYGHFIDELMKRRYQALRVRDIADVKRHDPMFDDDEDNPISAESADDLLKFLVLSQLETPRWSRGARNDARDGGYFWVDSKYATEAPEEMFAEAYSAVVRPDQDNITELVNDFTYDYFSELLGLERKRRNNRKTDPRAYNSRYLVPPQDRLPNGLALERKPRQNQNIMPTTNGVDVGDRLHDLPNPTSIYDGRGRERLLTVGDHRFYDRAMPSPHLVGDKTIDGRAKLGAYRFVTDDTHSDMTRALSAVTMGFPLDDFRLHGNETDADIEMLRGVLTGNVAQLPKGSRDRVERATQDAVNIAVGIQRSEPTTENLYRAVPMTQAQFEQALSVDDEFPLPITAFTSKPNMDYSVNLTLRAGARALETDDDNWLTQGTFRVANVEERDGTLFYALEHTETYDPRHDAMRPVADGSDDPRTWRARGLASRRYTDDEATAMDKDRGRRLESIIPPEKEPLKDVLRRLFYPKTEADKDEAKSIIERTTKLVQDRINKRLGRVAEVIYGIYGDEKPWGEGVEAFRTYDAKRAEISAVLGKLSDTHKTEYMAEATPRMAVDPDTGRTIPVASKLVREPRLSSSVIDDIIRVIDSGEKGMFDVQVGEKDTALMRVNAADLTAEDLDTLRVMRDALLEMEKMYLADKRVKLDGDEYSFTGKATLIVRADDLKTGLSGRSIYFKGEVRYQDGDLVTDSWGRTMTFNDSGSISLYNDTLFIKENYKSLGIAALINNHAFLWGKEHGRMSVNLSTADSGPFVWVRSGFPVPSGSMHNQVVDGLIPRLKTQVTKYRDGMPSIIENDEEALRVAAWLQIAEDRPHKASLVTLYNSFDIDGRERGDILATYFAEALDPANKQLQLKIGDAPTDHLPYQVIIEDPVNFIRAWRNRKGADPDASPSQQRHALDIRGSSVNTPLDEQTVSRLANLAGEIADSGRPRDRSPVTYSDRDLPFLLEATGYNLPPILATEEEFLAVISERNELETPTHQVVQAIPVSLSQEEAIADARAILVGTDQTNYNLENGVKVNSTAHASVAHMAREMFDTEDEKKIPTVLFAMPKTFRTIKEQDLREARIYLQGLDVDALKEKIGYKRTLDAGEHYLRTTKLRQEIKGLRPEATDAVVTAVSRVLEIDDQIGEFDVADEKFRLARNLILKANEPSLAVLLGYDGIIGITDRITVLNRRDLVALDSTTDPVAAAKLVASVKGKDGKPLHRGFLPNPVGFASHMGYPQGKEQPWYEVDNPIRNITESFFKSTGARPQSRVPRGLASRRIDEATEKERADAVKEVLELIGDDAYTLNPVEMESFREKVVGKFVKRHEKRMEKLGEFFSRMYGGQTPWVERGKTFRDDWKKANAGMSALNNTLDAAVKEYNAKFGTKYDILNTNNQSTLNYAVPHMTIEDIQTMLEDGIYPMRIRDNLKFASTDGWGTTPVKVNITPQDRETLEALLRSAQYIDEMFMGGYNWPDGSIRVESNPQKYRSTFDFVTIKRDDAGRFMFHVNGVLVSNGKNIGYIERRASFDYGDKPRFTLDYFQVDEEFRSQGDFGLIPYHSFVWGKAAGFQSAYGDAAMDGVLVWPKLGYNAIFGTADPRTGLSRIGEHDVQETTSLFRRYIKDFIKGKGDGTGLVYSKEEAARLTWWMRDLEETGLLNLTTLLNLFDDIPKEVGDGAEQARALGNRRKILNKWLEQLAGDNNWQLEVEMPLDSRLIPDDPQSTVRRYANATPRGLASGRTPNNDSDFVQAGKRLWVWRKPLETQEHMKSLLNQHKEARRRARELEQQAIEAEEAGLPYEALDDKFYEADEIRQDIEARLDAMVRTADYSLKKMIHTRAQVEAANKVLDEMNDLNADSPEAAAAARRKLREIIDNAEKQLDDGLDDAWLYSKLIEEAVIGDWDDPDQDFIDTPDVYDNDNYKDRVRSILSDLQDEFGTFIYGDDDDAEFLAEEDRLSYSSSRRLEEVPPSQLRKIRAMMRLATHKNTPESEARVAEAMAVAAMRRYRPDLANDAPFMRSLGKMTGARGEKSLTRQSRMTKVSHAWVSHATKSFINEQPLEMKGVHTKPILRNKLKRDIMNGSEGGAPGKWTTRKAKLLAKKYREAGGGYRTDKPSRKQRTLSNWSQERFVSNGKGRGPGARYIGKPLGESRKKK